MDFVRLEPEQRASFEEEGFLVVPGAIGEGALPRVIEAVDRLAEPFLRKPELRGKPEYNHLDLRPGLLHEDALFALVSLSTTVPLIVQLLGANIHLHSTTLLCKRPEDPSASPFRRGWHRDTRVPKDLGYAFIPRVGIKICYCLTDFQEPGSGMTLLARKTHLRTEPLRLARGKVDPEGVEVCEPRLRAGDAFLFENRLFHTAVPNTSERVSKVLMYGYAYRWMKQEVYLETPDERRLGQADPITRQLLGAYRDVDTLPWAMQQWARRHGVHKEQPPWTVEV